MNLQNLGMSWVLCIEQFSKIAHEVLHSLGFEHEHQTEVTPNMDIQSKLSLLGGSHPC